MRWRWTMAVAATLATAACSGPKDIRIVDPWVRAPAAGNPGAAYLTLKGGATDETLISVSADVAIRAEMHESMSGPGGMESMTPIRQLAVPAGGTIEFKPGGRHIMLFDVNPGLRKDAKITLRLTFADGNVVEANAPWVAAGQPSPWS